MREYASRVQHPPGDESFQTRHALVLITKPEQPRDKTQEKNAKQPNTIKVQESVKTQKRKLE